MSVSINVSMSMPVSVSVSVSWSVSVSTSVSVSVRVSVSMSVSMSVSVQLPVPVPMTMPAPVPVPVSLCVRVCACRWHTYTGPHSARVQTPAPRAAAGPMLQLQSSVQFPVLPRCPRRTCCHTPQLLSGHSAGLDALVCLCRCDTAACQLLLRRQIAVGTKRRTTHLVALRK